ncbi:MAG TPA: type 2 lanthipeptide synthetase LanM family protein [Leptolyngbyaceae cyanobacterium]
MIVTQSDLVKIVDRARSLSELISIQLHTPNANQERELQLNDNLLNRWCEVVAQGNLQKFHKRLQWDKLNIIPAPYPPENPDFIDSQTLPAWAETLQNIVQTAFSIANGEFQKSSSAANLFAIEKGKPLPFEEVLRPALLVARQKLVTRLVSPSSSVQLPHLEVLSDSAYLSLERSLLHQLLNISGKTLKYEYARSRPLGQNLISLLNLLGKATPDKTQAKAEYDTFVQQILADGLLTFLKSYPVLARLMATAVDFWVEATAEFLQRLKNDLADIQQVFLSDGERGSGGAGERPNLNKHLGKVNKIQSALSDPHHSGKSVILLTFESGLKVVYKPKGLGIEAAFSEFLNWCNQQELPLHFKALKVCDRKTYGWVEYAEHLPCENAAAAKRFYQRAGMLLCLFYALRVVDCHKENLIACGEHLVLIDMETLMHQEVNLLTDLPEETAADTSVNLRFLDSVLRTGLLPRWEFSKNNRIAYDTSALGSIESGSSEISANVPILKGIPLSPHQYLDEIVDGFQQMYRFLIKKREILLAPDSPLAPMQNQRVRFIFRATRIYWTILQKSFEPQYLQDGIKRSIELEALARAFLVSPQKPDAWPIFHAEMKAMEQMDIPYFAAYPNSKDISFGLEEPIEEYFRETSYREVLTQLQNLNETDLAEQVEIIKGSFYARIVRNSASQKNLSLKQSILANDLSQITLLTKDQLWQEATRIAIEIKERAIWGADGSVKWISFAYIPNAERFQLMPLPEDIYNGNAGIALFLSALDYVRKTNQFPDLVRGALLPIRKFLQTANFESTRRFVRQGIGGGTGLGSIIYALVLISRFLQEESLIEDALGIANLITPKLIASDEQFDIMGGSSGAILGLLALYAETKDPGILQKANLCGQHLLANQISISGMPKAWKILGQKQYTGFSHGAAGIAYALLRLYEVNQDKAYLEAAREGLAYEDRLFSIEAGNWPDLRAFAQKNDRNFMVSWCHGASGIGLGRLGGLSILKTEQIDRDIEIALQTTQQHTLHDADCVCCGNFGRIETLLVAAQKLSRPELKVSAEQKAAWAIDRSRQAGGYLFPNLPNTVFTPSFFQGTSGIGYQLLRLANPEALPSVLLWSSIDR